MARFVIIDNWLDGVGGHNFQYAVEMLHAAAAAGYQPHLATARSFRLCDEMPTDWQVRPVFQYGWSRTHTVGVDGGREFAIDSHGKRLDETDSRNSLNLLSRPVAAVRDGVLRYDRRRRMIAFREGCKSLFDEIGFQAEDVIFLPSLSDFDFMALAGYLAAEPNSNTPHWHLQFHFDVFDGRPPDFASQRQRQALLVRQFSSALAEIPRHRLHFYGTTSAIAAQFNRLNVGRFQELPYPCSQTSAERLASAVLVSSPLRVTMAGGARREKGKHGRLELIERISRIPQFGVDFQLWIQGNSGRLSGGQAMSTGSAVAGRVDGDHTAPIVEVEHPLSQQDYQRLIHDSNIAILPYRSERYHARASGVLVEMLAAGVPVIVPAGSWLASQISESNYQYLDELTERSEAVRSDLPLSWAYATDEAAEECATADPCEMQLGGAGYEAFAETELDAPASGLMVRFAWKESRPGYFVRLICEQLGDDGTDVVERSELILGPRPAGGDVATLVRLARDAKRIRITLVNAYNDHAMTVGSPQVLVLDGVCEEYPTGKVGLIATDAMQVPRLLEEMVRHYDHYRRSAIEFSAVWRIAHSPSRTVEILRQNTDSQDAETCAA